MAAAQDAAAGQGQPRRRRIRADAQRNRDAILRAARETFEAEGVLASLDGIALRAGVGNATLYRNFPTREDLLAAVMQAGIEEALAEAADLAHELSAREALTEWLVGLTWKLRIWHDLPHCVATAQGDAESSMSEVRQPLISETEKLLQAAKSTGDADEDVTGNELFELVTALSWAVDQFGDDEGAARRRVMLATTGGIFRPDRSGAAQG